MPKNRNKTAKKRCIRKTGSKRNKRVLKRGGTCGCGQNKFLQGGQSQLSPIPFTVPQQNMIPLNTADNQIYNTVSARNLNGGKLGGKKGKRSKKNIKKTKGGSIMNMFNSFSNSVTGASDNGVFSFGTIPGASTSAKILYGVPFNNPSTWVQPVQNVYSKDNPPLV